MSVKIAVPKGHLEEQTVELLQNAGIGVTSRNERQLFVRTSDPEIELVFVRAEDIPDFVAKGATDLGITGYDIMCESGGDVIELLDLSYGFTRMVVASREESDIKSLRKIKAGARIATEFPNITKRYFAEKGIKIELVRLTGAAEIAPLIGVADLIVDVTSTGTTLRAHGLRVITTILESSARLIANKQSLQKKRAKIDDIVTAMNSVVRARGKKLMVMNVPEAKLEEIKRLMPGMAGPTVSRVESTKPMLSVQAVVDEAEVYKLVKLVKRAGARDVLVLPIERVLP
ncbi:MAG: ATP phosphoribosyltransferase [Hadesarchaea archaeon]|nr:ATP phosphoribosyltransferase [Hadesarchaea archaeon]MDH5685574.1 ATP phosphoribosyltransferase [Hadesarchaea archaeon]